MYRKLGFRGLYGNLGSLSFKHETHPIARRKTQAHMQEQGPSKEAEYNPQTDVLHEGEYKQHWAGQ